MPISASKSATTKPITWLRDTDEADIRQKIGDIRKKSELFSNVSFAVGYRLMNKCGEIRQALSEADALMYADKEACYRLHPEMKRRLL